MYWALAHRGRCIARVFVLVQGTFLGLPFFGMILSGLGGRLRRCREQAGLSAVRVAELLGCDVRTLYRWERNEFEPSIGMLARLAALYGVTPTRLVSDDDNAA